MKLALVIGVGVAVAGLDQVTKWFIESRMDLYQSIPVIDSFFHITYIRNPGGAFGFLRDASATLRMPFFIGATVVAVFALLYFVRRIESGQYALLLALGGILGGATGNLIDRVTTGTVIDFFDLHWRGWHWPTFNVADSFITTGVIVLLLHSLLAREPQ
jgi:signal peptidase II